MSQMLEKSRHDLPEDPQLEGRVRFQDADAISIAIGSESSRDIADFEPDSELGSETYFNKAWDEVFESSFPKNDHTWHKEFECACAAFDAFSTQLSVDGGTRSGAFNEKISFSELASYLPVERNTRPMTAEEQKLPAVREARLKELKSWIENQTGFAMLKAEFLKLSGCLLYTSPSPRDS